MAIARLPTVVRSRKARRGNTAQGWAPLSNVMDAGPQVVKMRHGRHITQTTQAPETQGALMRTILARVADGGAVFSPETIDAMSRALDEACAALRITDAKNREAIAMRI